MWESHPSRNCQFFLLVGQDSSPTSGDLFDTEGIIDIIGCVAMGYICSTTRCTTTVCSSKDTQFQSHIKSSRIIYQSLVRIVNITVIVVMAVMITVIMLLIKGISAEMSVLVFNQVLSMLVLCKYSLYFTFKKNYHKLGSFNLNLKIYH